MSKHDEKKALLRSGWTTGACASAAARAAYMGFVTNSIPSKIEIRLPRGERPVFDVKTQIVETDSATAGVIKDAGDDPDVTHGAEILVTITAGKSGEGIVFRGGTGVGIVTKPGIPVPVGEPAINPGPRKIITENVLAAFDEVGGSKDIVITISIPNGDVLATKTLNPRLGILNGLSVLGTTGVVVPYSCEAYIQSIQRAIDVAHANGIIHVAGSTGYASERAVQQFYNLDDLALIDMGDFIGGMLRYLRAHPMKRVTISGGFAKLAKLAEGCLNVHSKESRVDFNALASYMEKLGASKADIEATRNANSAMEVLSIAQSQDIQLAEFIAAKCAGVAREILRPETHLDILIVDRHGEVVGHAG